MYSSGVIKEAQFSPKIKIYIFLSVTFFLLITIIGIPFLILWLLGIGQYVSRKYYNNLKCNLSERHLEFRKGAFFKVEKTIPLENIQDLTFIENPILNKLDLRILKIETAGSSNPNGSDMKLIGIVEADKFKKQVLEQRERIRSASLSNENKENGSNETTSLLIEIRELLKEIRNLNKS